VHTLFVLTVFGGGVRVVTGDFGTCEMHVVGDVSGTCGTREGTLASEGDSVQWMTGGCRAQMARTTYVPWTTMVLASSAKRELGELEVRMKSYF